MSCLPIVSDRAATEGSKYFELGRQPHKFLTRNTCLFVLQRTNNHCHPYIDTCCLIPCTTEGTDTYEEMLTSVRIGHM